MSTTVVLNDGNAIPRIGLGTWQSKPHEVENAVAYALKDAQYRHIDCAWVYGNEAEVGQGIRKSGVKREDIFITSKLWGTFHDRAAVNLQETLDNLGVDYIDLYLIHWPVALNPNGQLFPKSDPNKVFPLRKKEKIEPDAPEEPVYEWEDGTTSPRSHYERDIVVPWSIERLADTWKQLESLKQEGKVKSIGVSNFSEKLLRQFLPLVDVKPAVNQLELHLYNPDLGLLKYLQEQGIVPEAYSPLGSTGAPLLEDETVIALAKKHTLGASDIVLGWLLVKGCVILPKSVTQPRILSNLGGAERAAQVLEASDITTLDGVAAGGKQKRLVNPPWGVDLGFTNA